MSAPSDGARADARKRLAAEVVAVDVRLDVAAEHVWHNIESGLWYDHRPLAKWLAGVIADAKAEALREAARVLIDEAGPAWGGSAAWLTTGTKVAAVAAEWIQAEVTS